MILAAFSRSSLPAYRRSDSLHCRRVSRTQATDFESYVLDLQSSIKSEAERLEADSGKAVKFQDDRCGGRTSLGIQQDYLVSRSCKQKWIQHRQASR